MRCWTEGHGRRSADASLSRLPPDGGPCHGIAGVYPTAYRAAADAHTPSISQRLPAIAAAVARHARNVVEWERDYPSTPTVVTGLLTG